MKNENTNEKNLRTDEKLRQFIYEYLVRVHDLDLRPEEYIENMRKMIKEELEISQIELPEGLEGEYIYVCWSTWGEEIFKVTDQGLDPFAIAPQVYSPIRSTYVDNPLFTILDLKRRGYQN